MALPYSDLKAAPLHPKAEAIGAPNGGGWFHAAFQLDGSIALSGRDDKNNPILSTTAGSKIELPAPRNGGFIFPILQSFSDGRTLVVEARVAKAGKPNAHIFSPDRKLSRSFFAGDAVLTALVDSLDRIWIGYFDEGIGMPVSSEGLCCFSDEGELLFGFNGRAPDRRIVDAYAMTLDNNDCAWVCPYTEFYVSRICGVSIEFPIDKAPTAGAGALLVTDDHMAFFGGHDRECMVTLIERRSRRLKLIQLISPGGEPLPPALLATRGPRCAAISHDRLFRLDMPLLLEAAGTWGDESTSTVDSAVSYIADEMSYADSYRLDLTTGETNELPGALRPADKPQRDDDCGG